MPYVRVRDRQVAIVHGVRDSETRKVEQQILFVLYSRAEAREALGRGGHVDIVPGGIRPAHARRDRSAGPGALRVA